MSAALDALNLGRRYGATWGLRECHLSLQPGQVVGLVGPNGAGKSTLLMLASGVLAPSEGTVQVFGTTVAANNPDTRERVRFVAQEHPLYGSFSVGETLELGRRLNPRWDASFARDRIAALGIPVDRRVRALSGGERAQVSLTIALAARSDLLLLDEPLANLDPLARGAFLGQLMEAVAGRDLTVVISSHVLPDLERIIDHLVVLGSGRVQLDAAVNDLLSAHAVLVGPVADLEPLLIQNEVVRITKAGRQATVVVRGARPLRPGWEATQASLEEILLAYMANPAASLLASTPYAVIS